MRNAPHATSRRMPVLRARAPIAALALSAALVAAPQANAQSPQPSAAQPAAAVPAAPSVAPAADALPSPPASGAGSPLASAPVAIVPIDKSIPGAALSVVGSLQASNGRAFITGSGTITAGGDTAQVALPYRGTMHVCASSAVKLAADTSTPAGETPGLLVALDHGAVEMSLAASNARARNADTLLTPYFRIMIGGPNPADVSVRLGENGDTCVDNAGANAPYVVVTSVFEGGLYRVLPSQRVMFEHGSLQSVVDQEKEPCGCPPPPKSEGNEFPLAASEGMAPASKQAPVATAAPASGPSATETLSVSGTSRAPQPVAVPAAATPTTAAAPAGPAAKAPASQKKPGLFRRIGRFFKRVFGAE
jgi:hypothetical protein